MIFNRVDAKKQDENPKNARLEILENQVLMIARGERSADV